MEGVYLLGGGGGWSLGEGIDGVCCAAVGFGHESMRRWCSGLKNGRW